MAKNQQQFSAKNEYELAEQAAKKAAVEAAEVGKPIAGQPLPHGIVNPPCGTPGHMCLDPKGLYQPTWYSLKIHKVSDNMPSRQYFNLNGKSWYVTIGVWVDVPPEILIVLADTDQQVISMNIERSNLQTDRGVPVVVDVVPRFSYNSASSA